MADLLSHLMSPQNMTLMATALGVAVCGFTALLVVVEGLRPTEDPG